MKKISLISLIYIFSFYNSGFAMQQKTFVFSENVLMNAFHYTIGLLGIKACDSKNHVEIKINAAINCGYGAFLSYENLKDINENYKEYLNSTGAFGQAGSALLGLFNVQFLVNHVKFCYQNLKIFRKSEKIAKFNKTINLNMFNEKIKQLIWLTINTALPYFVFAGKRIYYDKVTIKEAFNKEDSFGSGAALYLGSILKNISEDQRRHTLYKKVKKETLRRLKQST